MRSSVQTAWKDGRVTLIDLRSDTVTRPTEAMRAAMAARRGGRRRLRRGPDRPRARGARRGAVRPRGRAVHADRVDGQRARGARRWSRPARRCSASRRPTSRGPSSAPTAPFSGITMRTWTRHRGQVDLRRAASACSPPTWARSSCAPRPVSVENTHNFAGGAVLPDRRPASPSGRTPTQVGARVHLDGARIWNAHVATGVPLDRYGAVADVLSVCLSKGLGAPVGLARGRPGRRCSPRPGSGASGWAAGCARPASSPRRACTRSTTTSSGWPTTTRTPGCWPRPAGSTRPPSTPTSWSSPCDDAPGVRGRRQGAGCAGLGGRAAHGPARHPPRRVAPRTPSGPRGRWPADRLIGAGQARVAEEGDLADGRVVASGRAGARRAHLDQAQLRPCGLGRLDVDELHRRGSRRRSWREHLVADHPLDAQQAPVAVVPVEQLPASRRSRSWRSR